MVAALVPLLGEKLNYNYVIMLSLKIEVQV